MTPRELTLTYERDCWHARGSGIDVAHHDLRGLEALIEAEVADGSAPVDVNLTFDTATLPRWLLQYHGHYCNYTLHVPRRGAQR
jgi:hypothetical protein